jgi:hypothetical protein
MHDHGQVPSYTGISCIVGGRRFEWICRSWLSVKDLPTGQTLVKLVSEGTGSHGTVLKHPKQLFIINIRRPPDPGINAPYTDDSESTYTEVQSRPISA